MADSRFFESKNSFNSDPLDSSSKKRKITEVTLGFDDYFELYKNWQDDPAFTADSLQMHLQSSFPYFIKDNKPNYARLKASLNPPLKDSTAAEKETYHKAKEYFRELFKMTYRLRQKSSPALGDNPAFRAIVQYHGSKIMAHGVEEAKGGMHNLLLMCISKSIKGGWGLLDTGDASMSPLPHGPYYLIADSQKKNDKPPQKPVIDNIERILVPFQENIDILNTHLKVMLEKELINEEEKNKFSAKLIHYQDFLNLLTNRKEANKENNPKQAQGSRQAQ